MQHWQCHTRGPGQYQYRLEDGDAVEEKKAISIPLLPRLLRRRREGLLSGGIHDTFDLSPLYFDSKDGHPRIKRVGRLARTYSYNTVVPTLVLFN